MVEKDRLIKVRNRSDGGTGYTIPDLNNLHRDFQINEVKEITFEELFKLYQIPGGEYIIRNYLTVEDEDAVAELLGQVEPEYYYTSDQVAELLNKGTLDELEDCLNFAPAGVIDLIKTISVTLPLNDIAKREMIFKKTGFNVSAAIELAKSDEEEEEMFKPVRKAAAPNVKKPNGESSVPVRKVVKKTV